MRPNLGELSEKVGGTLGDYPCTNFALTETLTPVKKQ